MSAKAVLNEAHKYNTTMTVFLSALLLRSIYMDMPARKKDYSLVLIVPINLRQFYKSETASNFFSTMSIEYKFTEEGMELDKIIASLNESFKKELTEERLSEKINWQMSIEKNPFARIMPCRLKISLFVLLMKWWKAEPPHAYPTWAKYKCLLSLKGISDSSVSYPMSEDLRLRYVHTGTKWR